MHFAIDFFRIVLLRADTRNAAPKDRSSARIVGVRALGSAGLIG